jgi:hypothetical protein
VKPITDNGEPEWYERARCRTEKIPTDVFFTKPTIAITICQSCPAVRACRELANVNGERHGVWGGQDRQLSSGHRKVGLLAQRVVRRRLPKKSEARVHLARLSIPELMILAEREGIT